MKKPTPPPTFDLGLLFAPAPAVRLTAEQRKAGLPSKPMRRLERGSVPEAFRSTLDALTAMADEANAPRADTRSARQVLQERANPYVVLERERLETRAAIKQAEAQRDDGPREKELPDGLADWWYTKEGQREWHGITGFMKPRPWSDGSPKPNYEHYLRWVRGEAVEQWLPDHQAAAPVREEIAQRAADLPPERIGVAARAVPAPTTNEWQHVLLRWCARYGSKYAWCRDTKVVPYNTLTMWFNTRKPTRPGHKSLMRMITLLDAAQAGGNPEHKDYLPTEDVAAIYALYGVAGKRRSGAVPTGFAARRVPVTPAKRLASDGPLAAGINLRSMSVYAPVIRVFDLVGAVKALNTAHAYCGSLYRLSMYAGVRLETLSRFAAGQSVPQRETFKALASWANEVDMGQTAAGSVPVFGGKLLPWVKLSQYRHPREIRKLLRQALEQV